MDMLMKTVAQALRDEVFYPIPKGFFDNVLVKRGLNPDDIFSREVSLSHPYIGAHADCLCELVQSISFSESDKSVTALSDKDKERLLLKANRLYSSIGEPVVEVEKVPVVEIMN